MIKLLTTSGARKIAYFLIVAAITELNKRMGLNIDSDTIFGLWGAALTLMQLESHFNLKQFVSNTVNAISGAATTSTALTSGEPIQSVTTPPMTNAEAVKMLQDLSEQLKPIYESVQSGKSSDAVQQGFTRAATILEYLKTKGA